MKHQTRRGPCCRRREQAGAQYLYARRDSRDTNTSRKAENEVGIGAVQSLKARDEKIEH